MFNDRTEWKLDRSVFSGITAIWGTPSIDLFASRLNTQLPCYVSWQPDPNAKYIDAFTIGWAENYSYIFPPFSLINTCLQKLHQDSASSAIVAPIWPSQCWFPQLMESLVDYPRILPVQCLSLPVKSQANLPPKVRLMAFSVSGLGYKQRFFQRGLPSSSWRAGDKGHRSNTNQSLISAYCSEKQIFILSPSTSSP